MPGVPPSNEFLGIVYAYVVEMLQKERPALFRVPRLGVIDPAYSAASFPGTLPKVTFEGEDTMSTKRYSVMSPYAPQPSDRVLLLPAGHTFVILGKVNS